MIILDVNVLVAAFLDDHRQHASALAFLEECLAADQVGVPDVVWSGFMRVSRNGKLADPPAPWPEVRAFMDNVRIRPNYRPDVRAMTRPADLFGSLCESLAAGAKLVSDAYTAAVAIDYGASVATFDSDFDRLPVDAVHPPLAA
jgi:toxin-antitoxin system PIN domain toxin